MGFPGGSVVKNPPANAGNVVQSLGQENPLKKEMATHSVFLSGKPHGERSLMGYSPWRNIKLRYDLVTKQQRRNQQEIRYKGADQWAGRQSSGNNWTWIENKEIDTYGQFKRLPRTSSVLAFIL